MFEPLTCSQRNMIHVFKKDAVYGDYCRCGDVKYEPASITKVRDYTQCQPNLHMFAGYPKNGDTCKCGEKVWQSYSIPKMLSPAPEISAPPVPMTHDDAFNAIDKVIKRAHELADKIGYTRAEAEKREREAIASMHRKQFKVIDGGKSEPKEEAPKMPPPDFPPKNDGPKGA